VAAVIDGLVGLGPIETLLREADVSDVFVNTADEIWVERNGSLERSAIRFHDQQAIVAAVERVIAPLGLRLDAASPMVDARLADGSRLHAAIPPVAVDGPVVAIRRFTQAVPDLDHLRAQGAITDGLAAVLAGAVAERKNLIVSGGTGAGKTTMLNILSRLIPPTERVVTVEDAAELNLAGHVVRLEARPPNAEGAGAISLEVLIRAALRLRPDRIVVGEVRGPEALDMVAAMNTGHDGSMSTVHANNPADALLRLETLALAGGRGASELAVRRQLHAAVDLIVHVERRGGHRRVASVAAVTPDGVEEVP
jgi:pilus assembly protein CpaF